MWYPADHMTEDKGLHLSFKQIFWSLFGITALVILIHIVSALSLAGKLEERTEEVVVAYGAIVPEAIPSLLSASGVTLNQREALTRAKNAYSSLATKQELRDRLLTISDMQQSLSQMYAYTHGDDPIAALPAYEQLRTAIDKRGPLQQPVDAYNTVAQQWNRMWLRPLGQLIVRVFDLEKVQLLGFQGAVEYQTTVKL